MFGHSFANGSSAGQLTPAPHASVLAFHATRPGIDKPVVRHHAPTHQQSPASLRIADTGAPCYVQITSRHGKILVRKIMRGHQHLNIRRHGLEVVLGNAGAVRIAVNGHHFRRAGAMGQVRHIRVR